MRAKPLYGDIYLQWREAEFGRVSLPGLIVLTEDDEVQTREFSTIEAALAYIRKLHNQRLTDDAKGKK